jgi:glycosyltransferase involved in cell wall biosynthesis
MTNTSKVSLVITTLNEEKTIAKLLDSLLIQSKKPDEIIIIDSDSTDDTAGIVRHYQKKYKLIKLHSENMARAEARNLGVELSKNGLIAMTDAGCVAEKDWLKNLTAPFANPEIDVAAGFYKMTGDSGLQKAMSVFLGVLPHQFGADFLPSTRSVAFTKKIWERVGGFPENLEGAAEDTVFNQKLLSENSKFTRVKKAVVRWGMPKNLYQFFSKVKTYSEGDVLSKIWINKQYYLMSHNVKALSVVLRYLLFLIILVWGIINSTLPFFYLLIIIYFFWSYRKVFIAFGEFKTAVWGPVVQVASDVAVISGFFRGILKKK